MVREGTTLRFDVAGSAGGYVPTSQDSARASIVSELGVYFRVKSVDLRPGGAFYEVLNWPFRADIIITTQTAYGALDDIGSIVAHAVYEATGYMPTVSAPDIEGIAQADVPGVGIGGGLADLLKRLESDTLLLALVVAGVVAFTVYMVGGKTTRVGVAL